MDKKISLARRAFYWIVPLMVVATVGCNSKPLPPITPPNPPTTNPPAPPPVTPPPPPVTPPPPSPTMLGIGTSAVAQCTFGQPSATGKLSTNAVTTKKSGSVLLVSLARGYWASPPQAPTDNQANTFTLQGSSHTYIDYPSSATGLYHAINPTGAANHVFSMPWDSTDELTISAIEVTGATTIEDSSWVERSAANTISSANVHTNGAAMLVAWWWGSGGVRTVGDKHKAIPGNGFTLIPGATGLVSLSESGYIQVAAAYRVVNAAGDYTIPWDTDNEGAQLYLVALR